MQLLTSLFIPFFVFIRIKAYKEAAIIVLLQLTLIGWFVASYLSYKAYGQLVIQQKLAKVSERIRQRNKDSGQYTGGYDYSAR